MKRQLEGTWGKVFYALAALFSGFYFFTAGFGLISTQSHRGIYIMLNSVLAFLLYAGRSRSKRVKAWDIALCLAAIVSCGYWIYAYAGYAVSRFASPNTADIAFGIVAIIVVLCAVRRVMGWVLVFVTAFFLAMLYFGQSMPGIFSNRGFSITRIIEFSYCTMEGIFGSVTATFATYVIPFMIFGAMLEVSGAGAFYIDIARSITRKTVGGPAKMAVLSSALIGSISGSSAGNVATTGIFTIPMMKKAGFAPEDAGAIEAAASTGGQFLPPVMGAAAFLLSTFCEVSYFYIAAISVLPAFLYFYWVYWAVHHHAKKKNIVVGQEEQEQMESPLKLLKTGWYHLVPLAVIIIALISRLSVPYCGFFGTLSVVALSWLRKETRVGPKKFCDGLVLAAKNNLMVGATIGCLGIVLSSIVLAGLGTKFGSVVVAFSQGNLFIAVILVSLVATLIGMGATQTGTYIVVSLVAVPALTSLGISKLVAHIISFWAAGLSNVTPPVCVAAYAGASIADANPMRTGFSAMRYSVVMYLMPFVFAYYPEILAQGTMPQLIWMGFILIAATPIMTATIEGYWNHRMPVWERLLLMVLSVMIMYPELITSVIALAVFAVYYFFFQYRSRKAAKVTV